VIGLMGRENAEPLMVLHGREKTPAPWTILLGAAGFGFGTVPPTDDGDSLSGPYCTCSWAGGGPDSSSRRG